LYALYNPDVSLRAVMWLVGLSGAAFGALVRPVWTHNLIGGQILAGIVSYPPDSVMPALYLTPWSLLIQLAALGLRAGLSEWTLSMVFSALQAGLGTLALAGLSWVFSRRVVMVALVPAVALVAALATPMWVGSSLRVFHGHLYPNVFPVGPALFAPVAMFTGLIALALAANRRWTVAGGLVALLPCLHIGLAVPFALALGVMGWLDRVSLRAQARPVSLATAVGVLVTLGSGVWSLAARPDAPPAPPPGDDFARVFAEHWVDHSRIVAPHELAVLLEMVVWLALLIVVLPARGDDERRCAERRLLLAVAVVSGIAAAYTVTSAVAPGAVPWPLRAGLITRWLNITSWVVFAGSLAALGRSALEGRLAAQIALGAALVLRISGVTVGVSLASQWDVVQAMATVETWSRLARTVGVLYPLVVVGGLWAATRGPGAVVRVPWGGCVLAVVTVGVWLSLGWQQTAGAAGSGACETPLAVARLGTGGLLVGADLWDASYVQVRTRRPVVFDPMDVNIVPFAPAAHAGVAALLRDVYAADPLTPPPAPLDRAWDSFTPDRWRRLAQQYHATEVLAGDHHLLPLPVLARGGGCTLYRLP
jgi:hypothetical protein